MKATITVKDLTCIDSGLWPETAFTGEIHNWNSDSVEIINLDYGYMIFMYGDLDKIEFLKNE